MQVSSVTEGRETLGFKESRNRTNKELCGIWRGIILFGSRPGLENAPGTNLKQERQNEQPRARRQLPAVAAKACRERRK